MTYQIKKYISLKDEESRDRAFTQIKEIFFSNSQKVFDNLDEKEVFQKRWLDNYFTGKLVKYVYLVCENEHVRGYLTGSPSTKDLMQTNQEYLSFKEWTQKYPAHLHINLESRLRGKGQGSLLVEHFCKELSAQNITGVHVITSPNSRNITFYQKNKFNQSVLSSCERYLFLGKELNKIG